jgi:hypothetical protein
MVVKGKASNGMVQPGGFGRGPERIAKHGWS